MKRSLSHVWVYVYVRTAARGWARCHCGEAVRRSEALAVWSGVDCTIYLTIYQRAEIRHSFNAPTYIHHAPRSCTRIWLLALALCAKADKTREPRSDTRHIRATERPLD